MNECCKAADNPASRKKSNADPDREKRRSRHWKVIFLSGIAVLFITALVVLRTVLTPVLIALVLAYVADPLLRWLEGHRLRRWMGTVVLYIVCISLVWIAAAVMGPRLINQTRKLYGYVSGVAFNYTSLVEELPAGNPDASTAERETEQQEKAPREAAGKDDRGSDSGKSIRESIAGFFEAMTTSQTGWRERIETYLRGNAEDIASRIAALSVILFQNAMKGLSGLASFVLGFVLVLIFAFVFMLHFPAMIAAVRAYIPAHSRERTLRIISRLDAAVSNFFRGRLLVCLVSAAVYVIGFRLSGIDYWLLLGLVGGILGFIPILGVVLPMIPTCAFSLLTPHPWLSLIGVLATFSIVQWLVEPLAGTLIMSHQVKMHPLSVLLALLIGGYLFGMFGLILSIPLAATIKILGEEFVLPPLRDLAHPFPDPRP